MLWANPEDLAAISTAEGTAVDCGNICNHAELIDQEFALAVVCAANNDITSAHQLTDQVPVGEPDLDRMYIDARVWIFLQDQVADDIHFGTAHLGDATGMAHHVSDR